VTLTFADKIDPIAIYAALVSTTVLIWNIFVWFRNGPRLRVSVSTNMGTFGRGIRDDSTYIVVNVRNVGTQQTTITHVVMFAYRNWWDRFRKKTSEEALILDNAVPACPIPYMLQAGQTFMSMGLQTEVLEKRSRDRLLYAGVIHSFCDRPVLARVRPINPQSAKKTEPDERDAAASRSTRTSSM
jgi:hypothetical protein